MMAAAKPVSGRSLYIQNGEDKICYDVFYGNRKPSVMYLPCLFYPKNNAKATNLENWCKRNGHTFVCADYYGVRKSRITIGCYGSCVCPCLLPNRIFSPFCPAVSQPVFHLEG
jgi:hypothetical protein